MPRRRRTARNRRSRRACSTATERCTGRRSAAVTTSSCPGTSPARRVPPGRRGRRARGVVSALPGHGGPLDRKASPGNPGRTALTARSPGYGTSGSSPVGLSGSPTAVQSKALPAGSYILDGQTTILATSSTSGGLVGATCHLIDTAVASFNPAAAWQGALAAPAGANSFFEAETALPLQGMLTTTTPSTVAIQCSLSSNPGSVQAFNGFVTAVQTTSNS
jgi:hypothetical protein